MRDGMGPHDGGDMCQGARRTGDGGDNNAPRGVPIAQCDRVRDLDGEREAPMAIGCVDERERLVPWEANARLDQGILDVGDNDVVDGARLHARDKRRDVEGGTNWMRRRRVQGGDAHG